MTPRKHTPTRRLRDHPDLIQLKRQAKELLKAFVAGERAAVSEVETHYHGANAAAFRLHDAQLVLARSYGFDSWNKLKAYVDGVTVRRLVDAVRAGDLGAVTAMVTVRPELVDLDVAENDEHRALHYAVLQRRPEIVRFLMRNGADARKGMWPHRDATAPLTIAAERKYTEIVAIIEDEERRRSGAPTGPFDTPVAAEVVDVILRGDQTAIVEFLKEHPAFIQIPDPRNGMTMLHWAAARLWERLGMWLLDHGARVGARTKRGYTPLDLVGCDSGSGPHDERQLVAKVGELLLHHGAERTPRWAVVAGDTDWLRARHAQGALTGQRGLLGLAVRADRPDVLELLLELGFDPDDRERVSGLEEVVYSWGEPLRECARSGNHIMAAILLDHGADPNTNVYAASSAMYEAYARHDRALVQLLENRGGLVTATAAGYLGLADHARKLFEDEAAGRLRDSMLGHGANVGEALLEGAADGGHAELVRMALDRLDWPPGDSRWHYMLMRPFGRHTASDRPRYLTCFQMIVDRSGVNLSAPSGRTPLHDVAADWPRPAPMGPEERIAFATILLDRGARLDVRDDLLRSTPLGWACRWGQIELVSFLLERGADPVEADAEPWATPRAWAEKMRHEGVLALLRRPYDTR